MDLREVQHAPSALEAQAWPIVAGAGGDTDTVVRRLALVTGIVGGGKDELARAFLDHRGRAEAEAEAARLAERLDRLFKGTDSPPQGQSPAGGGEDPSHEVGRRRGTVRPALPSVYS